ncbi:MAG TPA: hypothetical protein VJV75_12165, partial [Candidatus Polarisedimenticolia bacterium]|nr:hypothetical protein [Candidatus Polarisedimenticolia bacterium]
RTTFLGAAPLDKPPEVLRERAREILAMAGVDRRPADSLFAFEPDLDYLEELVRRDRAGAPTWHDLGASPPGAVRFGFRESAQPLSPIDPSKIGEWLLDPPDNRPGMARVTLDPGGRLVGLLVVPEERAASSPAPEPDWTPLLQATGVDAKSLASVPPEWAPPVWADRRVAWSGAWPGREEASVRIEAASKGGRPVALRVVLPWTRPAEEPTPPGGLLNRASVLFRAAWPLVVLIVAGLVALRNVRRGRGDRRGALRFACYLGAARMIWLLGAHHVAAASESMIIAYHLAFATWGAAFAYVFYLALEPYARGLWPRMLVSWVRTLEGRFRDPLVGRDLLIGSAAGGLIAVIQRVADLVPQLLGAPRPMPLPGPWALEPLRGAIPALVAFVGVHTQALGEIIFPVTSVLLFRLLLRRTDLALVVAGMVGVIIFYPDTGSIPVYLVTKAIEIVICWSVLSRAGLLAFATMFSVMRLFGQMPLTPHPAEWYAGTTVLTAALLAAPAIYGFWIARAGRPLLPADVLEPSAPR